jgi:hypothetical protein
VQLNSDSGHISEYGETVKLAHGDSLLVAEHHISFRIAARLGPEAGLALIETVTSPGPPYKSTNTFFAPASK